jgi:hypothetical protein
MLQLKTGYQQTAAQSHNFQTAMLFQEATL